MSTARVCQQFETMTAQTKELAALAQKVSTETARPLPTRHLAALVQRAVPVLRYFEKVIHPRWPTPFEATKRLVGTVVVILNTTLVFTPIPLSNVVSPPW